MPFNVEYIIRAWDETREGLAAKTAAIKNAINGMNGAQYLVCALPTTARKLFYQSWPGCPWGRYSHRKLYAETRYLADVLPFSATFTGHLEHAEALYEGNQRNLVGVTTFSGSEGNETPQHAVLLGMSGAGKSVTVCDLLSQTEAFYDYTVIIEEGLSYEIYTRTVEPNARPIIIQPDGDLTINYLDTHGLPLTAEHLASAMALVARIAGVSSDEDKQLAREAQIAKYIMLLYEDVFEEWSRKNGDRLLEIARHAYAFAELKRARPGATTLDVFVDFRDRQRIDAEAANEQLAKIPEEQVLRFLKEPNTRREVRNLAFAYFEPSEYPTHRMLQELLQLDASDPAAGDLATRLLPWCADGNYGCLLDGASNISLTGKIAHFELGYIPEAAKLLALRRRIPDHELHAPTHHHDAAPAAEAERLRRSRAPARHPRRRTDREGELRADAEVQLLEHLHRPAIRPLQRKPHPLRRLRQQPAILPHAPKRSRRSRRHGRATSASPN